MSWVHSYSKADFTLYTKCAAEYELAYHTVSRMEWRLDDFLVEGLIPATENTLAARSREIKETLDSVPSWQALPSSLRQLLDASEKIARLYLDKVVKNTTSKLLKVRLGESVLPDERAPENDFYLTMLGAQHQAQHMSGDDLSFRSASILSSIVTIIKDIDEANKNSHFFKDINNVHHFKGRVNRLVKSCELGDDDIRSWLEIWTSRITFAEGRGRDRDKDDWLVNWRKTFVCLKHTAKNLHGLVILAEAMAHKDWDANKRAEWLKQLMVRFEEGNKTLTVLQVTLATEVLAAFSTPRRGYFY